MTAAAFTHLCPGCFAEKGSVSTCPHCGYDESQRRGPLVLPHRTLLNNDQYLIGKVLGKPGGSGITYLAFDTKLETKVAIKEYLPRDLAGRDGDHATISAHSADDAEHFRYGLTQFLQEARTLAKFDHANIVRVRNFFEENGTGYLVMDYYDGITLADYLAQQPLGKLPEKTAVDILMPILDGLREVHAKNFLHRDIKPQNIYLTTGNRAILLDFGAARQAMSERSRSLSIVLSEGYAPYEQYHRRGEQGPWTDIYACAAVLYHAVAGQAPPPATERVAKDELDINALGVSAALANALRLGLAVDYKNRPQLMTEFQALLLVSGDLPGRKDVGLREEIDPTPQAQVVPLRPLAPTQSNIWTGKKVFRAFLLLATVFVIALTVRSIGEKKGAIPTALASLPVVGEIRGEADKGNVDISIDEGGVHISTRPVTPGADSATVSEAIVEARREVISALEQAQAVAVRREQEVKEAAAVAKVSASVDMFLNRVMHLFAAGKGAEATKLMRDDASELAGGLDAETMSWIRKSADQGNSAAQFALGFIYVAGLGINKDDVEAGRWFRKAADQGHPTAQLTLGGMYQSGNGVTKDDVEAARWFRRAADQGNVTAQLILGGMSLAGNGVTKNEIEAVRWFRKAAEQGSPMGQLALGGMYLTGNGVTKNETEAVRWLRKSADQGNELGQFALGSMYAEGVGVTKDDAEARRWLQKAAAQGNVEAKAALEKIGSQ